MPPECLALMSSAYYAKTFLGLAAPIKNVVFTGVEMQSDRPVCLEPLSASERHIPTPACRCISYAGFTMEGLFEFLFGASGRLNRAKYWRSTLLFTVAGLMAAVILLT